MARSEQPAFPVGFRRFTRSKFLNYQFNRWYSEGYARRADLGRIGAAIRTFEDYVREFTAAAGIAAGEGRHANATSYYRAAEFLAGEDEALRSRLYEACVTEFDAAFPDDGIKRVQVPFEGSSLATLYMRPLESAPSGETVLVMGGFDSLIEEFYGIWGWFARQGYDVIAFEGPGQGATLRHHGIAFDHGYDGRCGQFLDHYRIEEATLIGISMGGYWACRAAALEPRIVRLVLWPPVYNWVGSGLVRRAIAASLRARSLMNVLIRLRMRLFPVIRHVIHQVLHFTRAEQPVDAIPWFLDMNSGHLCSEQVRCPVVLLGGENDLFQPVRLLRKQQKALVNARSVHVRVFRREEHAHNHVQMGNLQLALDVIGEWLDTGTVQQPRQNARA